MFKVSSRLAAGMYLVEPYAYPYIISTRITNQVDFSDPYPLFSVFLLLLYA